MRKSKPVNGQRSRKPVASNPPEKPAGRVISVTSRRPSFNRAGLRFNADTPTIVHEAEIGPERFEAILAEPNLRCEEVD